MGRPVDWLPSITEYLRLADTISHLLSVSICAAIAPFPFSPSFFLSFFLSLGLYFIGFFHLLYTLHCVGTLLFFHRPPTSVSVFISSCIPVRLPINLPATVSHTYSHFPFICLLSIPLFYICHRSLLCPPSLHTHTTFSFFCLSMSEIQHPSYWHQS